MVSSKAGTKSDLVQAKGLQGAGAGKGTSQSLSSHSSVWQVIRAQPWLCARQSQSRKWDLGSDAQRSTFFFSSALSHSR